jgi:hypothetical protein
MVEMSHLLNWPKLWILGCARNCASHLPSVMKNIVCLRSMFAASEVLVLENDSADQTVASLSGYQDHGLIRFFSMPGLENRVSARTVRLAYLRNACMNWLAMRGYQPDDLVLVLDLDEVNAGPWCLNSFANALDWFAGNDSAAAIFANQDGVYYDLWALRHSHLCPIDIWARQLELHARNPRLTDEDLLDTAVRPLQFSIDPASPPVRVESAFGGLGFYKASWLQKLSHIGYTGSRCLWINDQQLISLQWSEHIAFHAQLNAVGGHLYIHPALMNWDTRHFGGSLPLNPGYWRRLQC